MKSNLSDMFRSGVVWIMPLAMALIFVTACSSSDDKNVTGGSTEDAEKSGRRPAKNLDKKDPA